MSPQPSTAPSPHRSVDWTPAFPLAELPVGRARALRAAGKQLALFRPDADTVRAVDNRCPHEGYPLAQGRVYGNLLLCAWHNFSFSLKDGRCLFGGEGVRSYPVRVVDGTIQVDLSDPDPAAALPALWESLEEALLDSRLDQAARDVVRLLQGGVRPEQILSRGAAFDALRNESGLGHAMAVAAELLPWLPRFPGPRAVLPIVQALEVASDPNQRRPQRGLPDAIDPGPDHAATALRLRALAREFRFVEACGLMRGALARGLGREVLEPWLFRLASDHFLSFGHGLIYQLEIFELLDRTGWQDAEALLVGHVYALIVGVRQESIPSCKPLRDALAAAEPDLAAWRTHAHRPLSAAGRSRLLESVLDGKTDAALAAVSQALAEGTRAEDVADTLVLAAAERLLRYDLDTDRDPTVQDSWLDVIHLLTFAEAARAALDRDPHPEALRHLLYAAFFIQRAAALDAEDAGRGSLPTPPEARESPLEGLDEALRGRRVDEAVAGAGGWLARGADPEALRAALQDRVLDDQGTRPIVVAHHVKSLGAAFRQWRRLGDDPLAPLPVQAAVKFLAAPSPERRLAARVHEALRFVIDGRPPQRLGM